jgi:hypothetical protein
MELEPEIIRKLDGKLDLKEIKEKIELKFEIKTVS